MGIFLPNHDNILCQRGILSCQKNILCKHEIFLPCQKIFYANMKYSSHVKTQIEMEFFMIIGPHYIMPPLVEIMSFTTNHYATMCN
jgi:hypothetical protein